MHVNINSHSIQELLQAQNGRRVQVVSVDNSSEFKPFGDDGLSFDDLLDVINPLQHLPIIGHIYREISGDEIDTGSKIAGAALYGGPIGAAFSVVSSVFSNMVDDELDPVIAPASDEAIVNNTPSPAEKTRYDTLEQRIKELYSIDDNHTAQVSWHKSAGNSSIHFSI